MNNKAITQHYYTEKNAHIRLVPTNQPVEDKEAAEVAKFNRWMDSVGWTIAVITGLAFAAVYVAQLGIRFGW